MSIRVPLSWLREYVDIYVTPEELARRLTLAGIEVEHLVTIGAEWENMYTGLVAHLEKHPNADRLSLATIRYGNGKDITVVTGAPNIREGQMVVLGLIGTRYIDQHATPPRWSVLKPAKIRGIETEGMVMSEAEMGLSEEHEGIIELDPGTPLGLPAREVLGETILEIEVTPNNGRLLSMVGLAREVAALFGGEVRYPPAEWSADGPPATDLLAVEIENPELCSRYSGAVVLGVKTGPSPAWMQRRITLAGMRPVNNIVDITNYVMLEMGQPLHAFNYNAVEGHKIIVRRAHPGEHIVTIDHVGRTLDDDMLAICDVRRPVAVAGVMGGEESEIGSESNDILLESAHFDPLSIRRTARVFNLQSEASYRFERYVDPNLTVPAMKRAAELMRALAGGQIARGYVDAYPRPEEPRHIEFHTSEIQRLLGVEVPASDAAGILRRLDFGVEPLLDPEQDGRGSILQVTVPTYRNDVKVQADLVEEVARVTGYDHIPETLLEGRLPEQEVNRSREAEEHLRDLMVDAGLDEVITYSVTFSGALQKIAEIESAASPEDERPAFRTWNPEREPIALLNPLSSRQDVMRPTLLPNLLDVLRTNLRNLPEEPVRIYELGKVYLPRSPQEIEQRAAEMQAERERYPRMLQWEPVDIETHLPLEPRRLSGVMSGPRHPRSRFHGTAGAPDDAIDFFDAKGVVETLLARLSVGDVEWVPAAAPLFHPGRVAIVRSGGTRLGAVGELGARALEEWDIPAERVAAWELDVEALLAVVPERYLYKPVSQYQAVRQDMAFVVRDEVPAAEVAGAIGRAGGSLVAEVRLFDIYAGPPVPEGHRSLAFAVTFSSSERPLAEDEVARLRRRIESALQREMGATLRA